MVGASGSAEAIYMSGFGYALVVSCAVLFCHDCRGFRVMGLLVCVMSGCRRCVSPGRE